MIIKRGCKGNGCGGTIVNCTKKGMKMLTLRQKSEYVKNPGHCPFCGSDQIIGDSYDYGGESVAQRIDCDECGAAWNDIYILSDIEEIQEDGNII